MKMVSVLQLKVIKYFVIDNELLPDEVWEPYNTNLLLNIPTYKIQLLPASAIAIYRLEVAEL